MSEEIEPHILRKFEIIQKLGKGAYGIVWKAIDRKTKMVVALKKVYNFKYVRCLMLFTMQLMLKGHLEKLCFFKS
jgi:hypothetical protein